MYSCKCSCIGEACDEAGDVDAAADLVVASAAGAQGQGGQESTCDSLVVSGMPMETQVTKLHEKDGQRHQSCHLIYKQWRNRYDVRGGRLRDYGGGAPARTSAATQSECP